MKKRVSLIIIIFIVLIFIMRGKIFVSQKVKPVRKVAPTITKKIFEKKQAMFIPYWTMDQLTSSTLQDNTGLRGASRLIYFGFDVKKYGIEAKDIGVFGKTQNKWLTLVMTNQDDNLEILKDKNSWDKIAGETVETVKTNNFDGVVLDLELSALPFDNVVGDINAFVKSLSIKLKRANIKFAMTIYGDTFFRKRPYDIKTLSKYTDEIMVMAYDFHKGYGEPGPNFPLPEFKTMVNDFLSFAPPEKLTIIFGMYGYDWQVDEEKRPLIRAKALTLNEIKKKFLEGKCRWENCIIRRDEVSAETEVNYTNSRIEDNIGLIDYHIVWFEDEQSVKAKADYLYKKGIGSIAYWAFTFF